MADDTPGCPVLPPNWWQDKALLQAEVARHGGNQSEAGLAHGVANQTISKWWSRHGLPKLPGGRRAVVREPVVAQTATDDDSWLLDAIKALGDRATVEQLADQADTSPRRVREAAARLEESGYRLTLAEHNVRLERVNPAPSERLHPSLFDGETVRVGVVSDTHLGSNEEALAELELAYDVFAAEGISQVWHAGDWGTGLEIFKGHHAEAKVHTLDEQVDYLIEHYPRRDGIVTRGISGNHDIGGLAARAGFDPIVPFAAARDDIEYLGVYDGWFETRPGTGKWIHLLHGAGGMSYSYSYKAQKLADSYPSARKPSLLIVGHWHVKGNIRARDIEIMWPGCFEWQSPFMKRLGLQPAVGFHILELRVADDGSIVGFRPEWRPFFPGRVAV